MEIAFHLDNVTFHYPRSAVSVLSGFSLTIRKGEFVGIVGPTGCGKTSLLKILSGVIPHYDQGEISGQVQILGRAAADWSLARLSEKIGLVMEDPEDQLFNLRVRDEVTWGLENRGLPKDEILRRAEAAMRFFGIEHLADRVTFDLSGGEKQRLALASIYAIDPEVMLLDKPTSELDPGGTEQVMGAVRLLKKSGRTAVIVEDKMDFLLSCCERLLLLAGGRIQLDASPEDFARELGKLENVSVRNSDAVVAALQLGLEPLHFFKMFNS